MLYSQVDDALQIICLIQFNYYSFIGHFSNLHQRRTGDMFKNNNTNKKNTYTYTYLNIYTYSDHQVHKYSMTSVISGSSGTVDSNTSSAVNISLSVDASCILDMHA